MPGLRRRCRSGELLGGLGTATLTLSDLIMMKMIIARPCIELNYVPGSIFSSGIC